MNFDWLLARPIAHRGLHDDVSAENSMSAYQKAIDNNYNIEIDIHLTKDGKIVVFHDDNTKRVCGIKKNITKINSFDLPNYKLKGTDEYPPLLEDLLKLVDGKVGLLIEIKHLNPFTCNFKLEQAAIDMMSKYKGNYAFQSFNFSSMKYVREHSDAPCGQLSFWSTGGGKRLFVLSPYGKLRIAKISKPHFIAFDVQDVENKYVQAYRANNIPVLTWTVKTPERLEKAKQWADNIIFEDTDISSYENKPYDTTKTPC